ELLRGPDDFLEVLQTAGSDGRIGIEQVRVIAKAGKAHTIFCAERVGLVGLRLGEPVYLEMGHSGELALGFAERPAHRLHARETFRARKRQDLFQGELREDGGDEAEFHEGQGSVVRSSIGVRGGSQGAGGLLVVRYSSKSAASCAVRGARRPSGIADRLDSRVSLISDSFT